LRSGSQFAVSTSIDARNSASSAVAARIVNVVAP
jgi:hypothetical protein